MYSNPGKMRFVSTSGIKSSLHVLKCSPSEIFVAGFLPKRSLFSREVKIPHIEDNPEIVLLNLVGLHQETERKLVPPFKRPSERQGALLGPGRERFEIMFARFTYVAHCIGGARGADVVRPGRRSGSVSETDQLSYRLIRRKRSKA